MIPLKNEMTDTVLQSAFMGRALLKHRSSLLQHAEEGAQKPTPPSSPPPMADIERVMSHVRTFLLSNEASKSFDTAISSILRDPQFATAWNNANAAIMLSTPREDFLQPVIIDKPLRKVIGQYRDEIQNVANAWATVVGAIFSASNPPRLEVSSIDGARLTLPAYLDDERLPIELWEALRARDAAAVCYFALLEGTDGGARLELLAEYAERHCRYQRQWLDFMSWAFSLPCPDIVRPEERCSWSQIFADAEMVEQGVDALFEHAQRHPDGLTIGDTSPLKD